MSNGIQFILKIHHTSGCCGERGKMYFSIIIVCNVCARQEILESWYSSRWFIRIYDNSFPFCSLHHHNRLKATTRDDSFSIPKIINHWWRSKHKIQFLTQMWQRFFLHTHTLDIFLCFRRQPNLTYHRVIDDGFSCFLWSVPSISSSILY
jgi:hypothetical protein